MQFWQKLVLVSAVTLLSLVFLTAAVAILVFLTRKQLRKYKYIDLAVFDWLQPRTNPRRNRFMLFTSFLGNHLFLIPANLLLIFYFLFISRNSWFSIRVLTIALSSLVLMLVLKGLFRRKRPLAPLLNAVRGLSFPSGHALIAVTFYGIVIYILFHTINHSILMYALIALLAGLILLIGFSRIYLRVHYLSDVVAGFIIGLLWLISSLAVLARAENYIREKSPQVLPVVIKAEIKAGKSTALFECNKTVNDYSFIPVYTLPWLRGALRLWQMQSSTG